MRVCGIDGGGLRNAIPRESVAEVVVSNDKDAAFKNFIVEETDAIRFEYKTTDPNLQIELISIEVPASVLLQDFQGKLLRAIYACPNGIHRMSPDIKDLVQTSNNLARVLIKDGQFTIQCLTRSSVDSEKMDHARAIQSALELAGAKVAFSGSYPGWAPKPEMSIVKLMSNLYEEMFHSKPLVDACHAGLECGIIGAHYPNMEMISFGPNILGAHSPDERVQISSVQKFWSYLMEILKRIPEAA
jgi:dipeptidase D